MAPAQRDRGIKVTRGEGISARAQRRRTRTASIQEIRIVRFGIYLQRPAILDNQRRGGRTTRPPRMTPRKH